QPVEVTDRSGKLWPTTMRFTAATDPARCNPAIHVNQVGYVSEFPKSAMVGYYLGSAGELDLPQDAGFNLIDAASGKAVFNGKLRPRPDAGFPATPPPYHAVCEADFSEFKTPGEYRLSVPGMGTSLPFRIDEGAAAAVARAYA